MKKIIFYFALLLGLILISPKISFAEIPCQPIYGGGENCIAIGKILINKTAQNPKTGKFIDNLGNNDSKYTPGQTVNFQISITNTGSSQIPQIMVKDIFPNYVTFSSGPGNFDNNTKTLTFLSYNLNPNETRNFTIQGKIADTTQLPSAAVTCVVNKSTLTGSDSSQVQDSSQFCIQKVQTAIKGGFPILPPTTITTTPATGPELIPLIGLLPTGIAGWFLRKRSLS